MLSFRPTGKRQERNSEVERHGDGLTTVVSSHRDEAEVSDLHGEADILAVVRRRQSCAFFVVDDEGEVLLADRASRKVIPHVAAAVRKLAASANASDSEVVAIRRLQHRYLVRLVSLCGEMGRRYGVLVEPLRSRPAKG